MKKAYQNAQYNFAHLFLTVNTEEMIRINVW